MSLRTALKKSRTSTQAFTAPPSQTITSTEVDDYSLTHRRSLAKKTALGKKPSGSYAPKAPKSSSSNPVLPCATSPFDEARNYFKSLLAKFTFPEFIELNKGATVEQAGCKFSVNLNGEKEAKCEKSGLTFVEDKNGNVSTTIGDYKYTKKKAGDKVISYKGQEVYSEGAQGENPQVFNQNLPTLCPSVSAGRVFGVTLLSLILATFAAVASVV